MNQFKLPKQLVLMNETFKIKNGACSKPSFGAEIDFKKNEIKFNLKKIKKCGFDLETIFWHELGHYLFWKLNLPDYDNEVLMESFGLFVTGLNKQIYRGNKNETNI